MNSVSFGSMFNPERIGKKDLEKKLSNPEYNIEHLRYGRELSEPLPMYPSEALGRSQVGKINQPKPVMLSDEDISLLSSLSSHKYGFSPDGKEFWVHSRQKQEDGTCSFVMGDGRLKEGVSKKDFIKGLIGDDVQGLNVAGKTLDGEPVSIAFVYDKETKGTTIYSSKYPDGEACLEYMGKDGFREAVLDSLKNLKNVYGATVWKQD